MKYLLLPFIAWAISGCLKFIINYIKYGAKANQLIGYGGFPSTHTTIVSSVVFLIGLTEGFFTPLFSLGLAILLIIIIDAHGLRRHIGEQATVINQFNRRNNIKSFSLRERIGHRWIEILGGVLLGFILAYIIA